MVMVMVMVDVNHTELAPTYYVCNSRWKLQEKKKYNECITKHPILGLSPQMEIYIQDVVRTEQHEFFRKLIMIIMTYETSNSSYSEPIETILSGKNSRVKDKKNQIRMGRNKTNTVSQEMGFLYQAKYS